MIKLLTNKYVVGAAGLLLVLAAVWGYGHYQYKQGYTERDSEAVLAQAVATSNAQASARAKEQEYAKLNARVDGQYLELAAAQLEAADLRAAVAAGNKRLSVRTAPSTSRVPGSPGAASVDHEATRADIDPGDAVDIIAILARGDEAIRQLNALQDWAGGVTD